MYAATGSVGICGGGTTRRVGRRPRMFGAHIRDPIKAPWAPGGSRRRRGRSFAQRPPPRFSRAFKHTSREMVLHVPHVLQKISSQVLEHVASPAPAVNRNSTLPLLNLAATSDLIREAGTYGQEHLCAYIDDLYSRYPSESFAETVAQPMSL